MPNSPLSSKFALLYLAAMLVAILALLAFGKPDDALKAFLIGAGGMFIAKIQTIFDFFFGSSQGSKDKDAINKGNPTP